MFRYWRSKTNYLTRARQDKPLLQDPWERGDGSKTQQSQCQSIDGLETDSPRNGDAPQTDQGIFGVKAAVGMDSGLGAIH